MAFFALKASYSSLGGVGQPNLEFKEMVRAFHNAGIEVILDVVFNHTAEGDELGPTLCFRGIDNAVFYTLAGDKRHYKDYTGTGNTVNANNPVVLEHIWLRCVIGWSRCMSMGFVLTWPQCSVGALPATCFPIHLFSNGSPRTRS